MKWHKHKFYFWKLTLTHANNPSPGLSLLPGDKTGTKLAQGGLIGSCRRTQISLGCSWILTSTLIWILSSVTSSTSIPAWLSRADWERGEGQEAVPRNPSRLSSLTNHLSWRKREKQQVMLFLCSTAGVLGLQTPCKESQDSNSQVSQHTQVLAEKF